MSLPLTSQLHLQADRRNTPADVRSNSGLQSDFREGFFLHSYTAQSLALSPQMAVDQGGTKPPVSKPRGLDCLLLSVSQE